LVPTLGLQAYDELRRMLVTGRLEPGMQLVNRKLADEIGMSMTPVREAVTRLASEGLVEHVPGAGAFVRRITRQELAQLYDVREALEPVATAQAAAHATPAEIAELRDIAARSYSIIRAIAARPERHADALLMAEWIDADQRFHEIIFEAARNRWLSKITADVKLLAFGFSPQRRIPEFLTVAAAVQTWRDHRRLIRALETRNAELAASTVLGHIRAGKAEVFAHLAANQAAAVSEEKPRRPIQRRGRPRGSKTKRVAAAATSAARSSRRKPGASR
jgi:DNA-binding GntR family transcriptional regulator